MLQRLIAMHFIPCILILKTSHTHRVPYRNPFVKLGTLLRLLFLPGTSIMDASSPSLTRQGPMRPRTLPITLPDPLSARRFFRPATSRSNRIALSFSSLNSRSARRADSWLLDSDDCSSSIVFRSFSTLSRILETSSESCMFCLSLRSI
ncbi:hypothetical protein EDB82DRAFT_145324 [Fusarium venenatum]|uniref:uncharacterized protein n=1 Tax=Fusarium venenatum TaxID=56646 RepID=UPI001DE252DD|nr:hypothetical protein EDB82DRAFT_145324 [Fusarium venenatum]